MNPIEAAAREIAVLVNDVAAMPLDDDHWKQYSEIIARHLFPLVKPEDVVFGESYWFRNGNEWLCGLAINELGRRRIIVDACDAIYGPIPMPGGKS